ncbi:MAG: fumarate hydratase [Dehalococcoidia bacterium]|nr:fumarate hydratase [Dehalococcoidia bacterium]
MREVNTPDITATVSRLAREANLVLGDDVLRALDKARAQEESPLGCWVLERILENARISPAESLPLCQDCGTAVVLLEIGQDVHVAGGDLYSAVEEGIRQGYDAGSLRKSMVRQPFSARVNTRDNTPAIIHAEIVPGDRLKITVMPKGGGAENKSRLFMLTPSRGREGVIESVLTAVEDAGSDPCPPIIVGVGIGGTSEKVMMLAKHALLRPIGSPSPDPEVAALEQELLKRVNQLGIGPQGLGGRVTAMAVHAEVFPSHLASLPVGVNIQCHSARHKEAIL